VKAGTGTGCEVKGRSAAAAGTANIAMAAQAASERKER
jgi:hypothetical protein